MDFVDKQHVVRLEIGEQRRQIAGTLEHRAAGLAQVDAQFFGDNVRQRGFAQPGRAEQQGVVERFAARTGSLNKNFQLRFGLVLADVVGQRFRPQSAFELLFLGGHFLRRHHARRGVGSKLVGFEHRDWALSKAA